MSKAIAAVVVAIAVLAATIGTAAAGEVEAIRLPSAGDRITTTTGEARFVVLNRMHITEDGVVVNKRTGRTFCLELGSCTPKAGQKMSKKWKTIGADAYAAALADGNFVRGEIITQRKALKLARQGQIIMA